MTCILFDVPLDASSLVQRAGRAGRRGGIRRVIKVGGLYDQISEFTPLIQQIKHNRIHAPYDVRPSLTGCLQQIASIISALEQCTPNELLEFLQKGYQLPEPVASEVIQICVKAELLFKTTEGNFLPSAHTLKMFDNKSVHRTFAATTGTIIVDERSQKTIGWAQTQGKATILLGGQGRKPISQSSDQRRVSVKNAEGGVASFMTPGKSVFAFTAMQYLPNVFKYFQE